MKKIGPSKSLARRLVRKRRNVRVLARVSGKVPGDCGSLAGKLEHEWPY